MVSTCGRNPLVVPQPQCYFGIHFCLPRQRCKRPRTQVIPPMAGHVQCRQAFEACCSYGRTTAAKKFEMITICANNAVPLMSKICFSTSDRISATPARLHHCHEDLDTSSAHIKHHCFSTTSGIPVGQCKHFPHHHFGLCYDYPHSRQHIDRLLQISEHSIRCNSYWLPALG